MPYSKNIDRNDGYDAAPDIRLLAAALRHQLGNKIYLRDLETLLLENIRNISPHDGETIRYLARDIDMLHVDNSARPRRFFP